MNLADTLRGLVRRWYIVLPGLLLAVAVAISALFVIKPGYERTATQLLLPGSGTVPAGASNPYLFLGSLAQAADIIVRAMGSDEVAGEVTSAYPGVEVQVTRDPLVSGPVILFTVTAQNDGDAAGAIDLLLERATATLSRLQAEQNVKPDDRITSSTLTIDDKSTLQQKNRLMFSVGAGVVLVVIVLLVASLVDGLSRRSRTNHRTGDHSTAPGSDHDDPASDTSDPDTGAGVAGEKHHDSADVETSDLEILELLNTQQMERVESSDAAGGGSRPRRRTGPDTDVVND